MTCFDIQTSANASVRIMSKHVALDWYRPIWNSRAFLILIFFSTCKTQPNTLPDMGRVKLLCIGLLHKGHFKTRVFITSRLGKSEEGMTMNLKIDGSSPTVSFLYCFYFAFQAFLTPGQSRCKLYQACHSSEAIGAKKERCNWRKWRRSITEV